MENIAHEILQQGGFVGPRFTGVFFFQNVFWRVTIPIVFGTRGVNALDSLSMMTPDVKQQLCSRQAALKEYLLLWADCFDYDIGFQESHSICATGSFASDMIECTEQELTSSISDLCQKRPNQKAMHSARDATEKALKAFLAHHANLTETVAKGQFGHNLKKLVEGVEKQSPQTALLEISKNLSAFARYEDRYDSTAYAWPQLWHAYRLAQFAAAEVLRTITGRNLRAKVQRDAIFTS